MINKTPIDCFVAKDVSGIWFSFQVKPELQSDGCWDYTDECDMSHSWIRRLTLEQMEFLDSVCGEYRDSLMRVRIFSDDSIEFAED